jgi:hypothetical protein
MLGRVVPDQGPSMTRCQPLRLQWWYSKRVAHLRLFIYLCTREDADEACKTL